MTQYETTANAIGCLDDPETRLDMALNILVQNAQEVKNEIGGVIGYTLSLDIDQTRTLWSLLAQN